MENDPNEVLKDIARMSGMSVEEPTVEGEVTDGERAEEGEEKQGQDEEGLQVGETDEVDEDEETLEQRYARLLTAHNALASQFMDLQQRGVVSAPTPQPAVESKPLAAPVVPIATSFSFDDSAIEKALVEDDPKALKQILVGLVSHVENLVAQTKEQTREAVLTDIPGVAAQVARQQFQLVSAIKDFYAENKDLAQYQSVVSAVANEIGAREPNLTIRDALAKTAAEVRHRLGLKKVAVAKPDRTPAFPKGGSGARKPKAPVLTGMRADIAAMQNAKY